MIHYSEALELVLQHARDYGIERVHLKKAVGRVLAENIQADRDFPPFNRATKDGIVLNYSAVENGRRVFEISGILPAGTPASVLEDQETCMEIMTGAVVPFDADTVVMYERLQVENGIATLQSTPEKGQNIHYRGSDIGKGDVILEANKRITASVIGVLASVGVYEVPVKKLPRVAVISTGNELVEVDIIPEAHQIRKSNSYALHAALSSEKIEPMMLHLQDDKDIIRQKLNYLVDEFDVLLLSGGVSRGKYDFIPDVLQEIGIEKSFHRVLQRPGKPFWFGIHPEKGTVVFSFPGNPVSTFANYHLYFKPWLFKGMGLPGQTRTVVLGQAMENTGPLTLFIKVSVYWEDGVLKATPVKTNGSGDLVSLAKADGLVELQSKANGFKEGEVVPYHPI
ncbi:molybdopterin molybdotransferase MoeA [Lentiprolixibacter aurantiacus]|uniref:Molybdopterin molybdenumtransferase n=1 Tax=Lentiprolixibacter aurantiacus TaxID=2993939 RepID=A0AAE3MMH9_9FLAO|nr:molybdopterin molybdotransferase MoeA [Lentiprolixibacter aurantiacus]MCX2719604.1 molybdopterin molybdotransferase MoeA [Lentiprolixibacter aurantiacus]